MDDASGGRADLLETAERVLLTAEDLYYTELTADREEGAEP